MNQEASAKLADLSLVQQDSIGYYPAEVGWEKLVFRNIVRSLRSLIERDPSDKLRAWEMLLP